MTAPMISTGPESVVTVTLNMNDRASQLAFLYYMDLVYDWQYSEIQLPSGIRQALNAVSDTLLVASDGEKHWVVVAYVGHNVQYEQDALGTQGLFDDILGPSTEIEAAGLWIFEGRLDYVTRYYGEGDETDSVWDGAWRRATSLDVRLHGFEGWGSMADMAADYADGRDFNMTSWLTALAAQAPEGIIVAPHALITPAAPAEEGDEELYADQPDYDDDLARD